MEREKRLRRSADIRRARALGGRGWSHPFLALYAVPNELERTRVGLVVGKRVARDAVTRNRVKRRLREAMRQRYPRLRPGFDVLVIARGPLVGASWDDLNRAVDQVLARARLLLSTSERAEA